ncbi:MAG: M23 family metallopeptidase [Alphaproteobacteria bacterium]|nr:M23 family metallopeptidase [Alphaproteobacteria bacterium]
MPIERIIQLLENSGFVGPGGGLIVSDMRYIWIEDPTCITRSLSEFINIAWIAISVVTVFLLLGWAIALIRGGKLISLVTNLRNLFLMFATLSLSVPIANMIWGRGDIAARGCDIIGVPIEEVQEILAKRDDKLRAWNENDLYEEFDIYDSAAGRDISAALAEVLPQLMLPDINDAEGPAGMHGIVVVPAGSYTGPTESMRNSAGLPIAASRHTSGRGNSNRRAIFDATAVLPEHEQAIARNVINTFGLRVRNDGAGRLDARRDGGERDHIGTDLYIGGRPAEPGTGVPALFSGTITRVGLSHTRRGVPLHDVVIQNDNGTVSRALYVASNLNRGDRVTAGQIIGSAEEIRGAYHNTPQHIHFELRFRGQIVDPETLF